MPCLIYATCLRLKFLLSYTKAGFFSKVEHEVYWIEKIHKKTHCFDFVKQLVDRQHKMPYKRT